MSVGLVAFILITLVASLFGETCLYFGALQFLRPQMPFLFYEPPRDLPISAFDEYMATRDPVLGWPAPSAFGKEPYDSSGSRIVPAFPVPERACVSIYGDSFAWAEEVDHAHAWGNILAELLGCRVANYGVGGYGTDQAYLRFLSNEHDEAEVVILCIYPHDFQRNVNQYRPLLVGIHKGNVFGLKPRYILSDSGELVLVPLAAPTKEQFMSLLERPASFFQHEYFLPGTPAGPITFEFPFTWFFFKAIQQEQVKDSILALLSGIPAWAGYASPGHPSRSFEIAVAIGKAFGREAEKRKKTALVLFLPTPSAVDDFMHRNTWAYQGVADALAHNGVTVVNTGPYFLSKLGNRSFCELLTNKERCRGHFNEEGNRFLAEAVHEVLAAIR